MACHQQGRNAEGRPRQQSSACLSNKTAWTWPRSALRRASARGTKKDEDQEERSLYLVERKVADQKISASNGEFRRDASKTRSHHKRSQRRYERGGTLFFSSPLRSLSLSLPSFFFTLVASSSPSSSSSSSLVKSSGLATISRRKWSLGGDRRVHWKAPRKKRLHYKLRYKVSVLARLCLFLHRPIVRRHPVARATF